MTLVNNVTKIYFKLFSYYILEILVCIFASQNVVFDCIIIVLSTPEWSALANYEKRNFLVSPVMGYFLVQDEQLLLGTLIILLPL